MARFRLPFPTPRQLHQDIDDELAHHLSISAEDHQRLGLSADEARATAAARLGNLAQLHRALYLIDHRSTQEKRLLTWLADLHHDLVFSLRRMRRRPLLFALILVTLAVGTGTVLTFFGAADIILLRPLPITNPAEVMTLWRAPVSDPELRTGLAAGTVADLAEESTTFATIAAAEPYAFDIVADGNNISIGTWRVTEGFFDILNLRPHLGRPFQSSDYIAGGAPVVIASHTFWSTRLNADPAIVGQTIGLDGVPVTLVGVLPPEFPYAEGRHLYTPLVIADGSRQNRVADYFLAYGRLKPGTAPAAGRAELETLASRSDARITGTQTPREIQLIPLTDALLGSVRTSLGLLALGALLLLVMTATSAAGLMVADTLDRQQELTVRTSLGAGRGRIIRQLLTEAVLLSVAAGAAGFAVGVLGLQAFKRWAPVSLPRIAELGIDPRLVMIALGVILLLGAFIGLLPARMVATADLQSSLKESGGFGAGRSGRRARLILVGTQVALASTLLGVGGLLVRSWMALQAEDQGYQAQGVLGFEAHVWQYFPTAADRGGFGWQAPEYLTSLPGVESAALISSLPLAPDVGNDQARISRRGEGQNLSLFAVVGSADVFTTMGIGVVEGRGFGRDDRGDGEPLVVVSQAAADLLFPGRSAVGEVVEVSYSGPPLERRIVGVVSDVRFKSTAQPGLPTVYVPHSQAPTGSFYLITRHAEPTAAATAEVQAGLQVLVPGASVGEVVNLGALQYQAGGPRRFAVLLLTSFAGIALALAAVSIFGLLAQGVRSRRQELGVRMAVGAWPTELRNMVLAEGLRLTGFGVAVGIAALLLGSGLLRTVVYGVPVNDPLTLGGVVVLVMLVAAVASWWPALQATRVDPIQVLRRE